MEITPKAQVLVASPESFRFSGGHSRVLFLASTAFAENGIVTRTIDFVNRNGVSSILWSAVEAGKRGISAIDSLNNSHNPNFADTALVAAGEALIKFWRRTNSPFLYDPKFRDAKELPQLLDAMEQYDKSHKETTIALGSPLLTAASNLLNIIGTQARESKLLNTLMLDGLKKEIDETDSLIVSTHYMPFLISKQKKGIFIAPDIQLQHAASNQLTKNDHINVVAPSLRNYWDTVYAGVAEDRIIRGTVLPEKLTSAISSRRQQVAELAYADWSKQTVLVLIGASGVEVPWALATIEALIKEGANIKALCGPGKINNTSIDWNLNYRRQIEELELKYGVTVEKYGGTTDWTRDQDNTALMELLSDSNTTQLFTRPNEMAIIASILGFEITYFLPFQRHEQIAINYILKQEYGSSIVDVLDFHQKRMLTTKPAYPGKPRKIFFDSIPPDRLKELMMS